MTYIGGKKSAKEFVHDCMAYETFGAYFKFINLMFFRRGHPAIQSQLNEIDLTEDSKSEKVSTPIVLKKEPSADVDTKAKEFSVKEETSDVPEDIPSKAAKKDKSKDLTAASNRIIKYIFNVSNQIL